ncbi:MAG: hypothetical protein MI745_14590 [Pseudomonadales bacterium]|nr:hypothetical protein [Pseudomonadales bacterium]
MNLARYRGLSLSLILALFCAQLLLAWHAPSHIDTSSDHQELLASADCQVCTHGHGLLALPASQAIPVALHAEPAPQAPAAPLLQRSEHAQHPPRGPPPSV